MIETQLITLGLLFLVAIIAGLLANKARQPVLLGLLVAGAIIGPGWLGILNDKDMISLMIEIGTILLLFVIGMEFSVNKLLKVGFKAMIITAFKVAITFYAGFVTAAFLGLGTVGGVFLGVMLSFTSTVVVAKVLEQKGMTGRKEIPLLMGILIIEDIIAVIALTFFSGLSGRTSGIFASLEHLFFGMIILVIAYLIVGRFAEQIIEWVMDHNSGEETITFLSLGFCIGFAYLAYYLGLSTAAGAFLAGSIVSSFRDSRNFENAVKPYMQIFSSLFFLAMGTMINFSSIAKYYPIILIIILVLLITRFISVGLSTYLFANFQGEGMMFSSIAMFSVGEFALIIAKEAAKYHSIGIDLVTISASVIFITALLMSVALKYNTQIYSLFQKSRHSVLLMDISGVSNYIRLLFDQLDTDSSQTKLLHRKFNACLGLLGLIVLVLIIMRRVANYAASFFNASAASWSVYAVFSIITLVMIIKLLRMARQMKHLLIKIMASLDSSMSAYRASRIFQCLVKGTILLFMGLLMPVGLFLFSLQPYFSIIALPFIIAGIWYLSKLKALLASHNAEYRYSIPSFRKINVHELRHAE